MSLSVLWWRLPGVYYPQLVHTLGLSPPALIKVVLADGPRGHFTDGAPVIAALDAFLGEIAQWLWLMGVTCVWESPWSAHAWLGVCVFSVGVPLPPLVS